MIEKTSLVPPAEIMRETLAKPSIFKSEEPLSLEYIPAKLPHRENQLKFLTELFRSIIHKPEGPGNRGHWDWEDGADHQVRDRHCPDSQGVEAEPPLHSDQLPRVPGQPLHDTETGLTDFHANISTTRILQRRTIADSAGPAGQEEPAHYPRP